MTLELPTPLVTTGWLADRLDDPALRIADASWYLPQMGRDGRTEYDHGHIPGAVFWDIDAIADTGTGLPHTVPAADEFARHMAALGIGDDTAVVVYDGAGLFAAARPWWMLRYFGHDRVAVLDGGLPKWQAEGRPLGTDVPAPATARFTATPRPALFRDVAAMRANLDGAAERCAGRDVRVLADPTVVLDDRTGVDDGVVGDVGARVNDRARTDEHAVADRCRRRDERVWVDHTGQRRPERLDQRSPGRDVAQGHDAVVIGRGREVVERAQPRDADVPDLDDSVYAVVEEPGDAEPGEVGGLGDDHRVPAAGDQDERWILLHPLKIGSEEGVGSMRGS